MNRVGAVVGAAVALALGQAAPEAVVLAYHDVVASGAEGYSVTAAALLSHIRLLRRLGMRIVRLDEIARLHTAGRPTRGMAALCFDDGLVGVHRHALDVMVEQEAPATVFAVSGADGIPPPWWPGSDRTMTRAELTEVHTAGLALGAHTRTHPSLPTLADGRLDDELGGGRADLEDLTGDAVTLLAYPQGHHDARVRAAAAAAGYDMGLTFRNGRLGPGVDPFRVPRLTMTARHGLARLAYHLGRPARSWPDHQGDAGAG